MWVSDATLPLPLGRGYVGSHGWFGSCRGTYNRNKTEQILQSNRHSNLPLLDLDCSYVLIADSRVCWDSVATLNLAIRDAKVLVILHGF